MLEVHLLIRYMRVPEYVLLNPTYISTEKSHGAHIPECEQ